VIPAVLMAAGGTTHEAKLNKVTIQRDGKTLWDKDAVRRAIAAGSTVDELELRPGDVIVVPRSGSVAGLYGPVQLVAVLLGIPVTIYTLTKISSDGSSIRRSAGSPWTRRLGALLAVAVAAAGCDRRTVTPAAGGR